MLPHVKNICLPPPAQYKYEHNNSTTPSLKTAYWCILPTATPLHLPHPRKKTKSKQIRKKTDLKGKRKRYTPPTYRQLIRKHCLYLQAQFFYIHTKCQHMHRAVIDRQIGKNTAWKRLYMMFCIILWNWVNISLCKAVRGYRYFAVIQYYCYCLTALFASFVNRGGTVRTCRGTLDRLGPFMFHISTTKAK